MLNKSKSVVLARNQYPAPLHIVFETKPSPSEPVLSNGSDVGI